MNDYLRGLWTLGITDKKEKQFAKKGIHSAEDLLTFFPRKYKDFGRPTSIHEGDCVFLMNLEFVNSKKTASGMDMIIANGASEGKKVSVLWFHQGFRYDSIYAMRGQSVLVAGKVTYSQEWDQYSVTAPDIFAPGGDKNRHYILPVYSKIAGMSDDYLVAAITNAVTNFPHFVSSNMPKSLQTELGLMDMQEAVTALHFPQDTQQLRKAQQRIRAEKMYFFSMMMLKNAKNVKTKSPFKATKSSVFNGVIKNLPYELTRDQGKAVYAMHDHMTRGSTINALVQGDVGCGKSVVAFLMMASMAENGHQAALLAPTAVLARQHYEDLLKIMAPFDIGVEFVPPLTSMRKKEKEAVLKRIKEGESRIIVGTHALLSDEIEFSSLGLIVTDEEHKFGVAQREKLTEKTADGVHYITMSATPIPRSLASVVYGEQVQLYLIQTMPAGRKPVKTAINSSFKACFKFINRQIEEGRQIYVVCPQIDSNEKMEGVASVTELAEIYSKEFGEDKVCTLTGKNTKAETAQILADFKNNEKSILIATTVIEVGVNVPNASTIIIHNAERFGLAGLHQLRGRVGRGGGEAYCVLFSREKDNERLLVMCNTNNGFEIAEEDLRLRGAGDLFGTEQSGMNEYINLVLSYPEEYKAIKDRVKVFFGKTL